MFFTKSTLAHPTIHPSLLILATALIIAIPKSPKYPVPDLQSLQDELEIDQMTFGHFGPNSLQTTRPYICRMAAGKKKNSIPKRHAKSKK